MFQIASRSRNYLVATAVLVLAVGPTSLAVAQDQGQRPMTFLDAQHMRRAGSYAPSQDGQWMLYTITTPDWQEDKRQSDIHLVSLQRGVSSSRQMTFTDDKNETSPAWAPDGSFFLFLSDRDASANGSRNDQARGNQDRTGRNQLYFMRPDGGEARKITDASGGVADFQFSPDGQWLVFRSGRAEEAQLHRLPVDNIVSADPEALPEQASGVQRWEWAPDGQRIYFLTPVSVDADEKKRRDEGFTVNIRNLETPLVGLWSLDLAQLTSTQLTSDPNYTVENFNISDDGRWIGYQGISAERYERNITEERINGDLYLLEIATGDIERLTNNDEVGEQGPTFSPDGRWVAFGAADDLTRYTMTSRRVYVRAVADRGGAFRKLGGSFHDHVGLGFWSDDSKTIYFNSGVRATRQLLALDIEDDEVRQVTFEDASLSVNKDNDSGVLLINYQDPATPLTAFTVSSIDRVRDRNSWLQLTDVNPQIRDLALGLEEEITWTSTDGKEVGGVLVKPINYQPGQRYPLIVAIHGGPASADVLRFNGGYGAQVYAGAGYAVLKPNYRGSSNYGEEFRTEIVGNYFPQGYDDIMTGVDYLIDEGIVDGNRMGALGWSAGGHWSNWILTHTDRFKGISSGAGTSNWISMYAQSDVQRNRQYYLGDELPYRDFDAYWEQSPIRYMENATTPTMVHVVEGDPRVPSPQSVELHMALKKLGIDTELFMYPGRSHGIPDARNRLVKSVSEMAWMDYYVRGIGEKFSWRQVLETLEETPKPERATTDGGGGNGL